MCRRILTGWYVIVLSSTAVDVRLSLATEIQNIQIGDGDVARKVSIPIWMTFPRTFTCPTLLTTNFKIEFEVSIVLVFDDDRMVSESESLRRVRSVPMPFDYLDFPIQLKRY